MTPQSTNDLERATGRALLTSMRTLADDPTGIASTREIRQALMDATRAESQDLLQESVDIREDLRSWGDDGPDDVITPLLARRDEVEARLVELGWGDRR